MVCVLLVGPLQSSSAAVGPVHPDDDLLDLGHAPHPFVRLFTASWLRLDLLVESRGLNNDHIAIGILYDLAGHRSQHLALVRAETAVTHDDQAVAGASMRNF